MSQSVPTLEQLYEWARQHSAWQEHALRLIAEKGDLDDSDIDQLVALARGEAESPRALAPASVPEGPLAPVPPPVALVAISEIERVNALVEGPIGLRPDSLNVIFGRNASGKSGLTRILKKVCTAADTGGPILPDYRDPATREPPSATIRFKVRDVEGRFDWYEGGPENRELRTIHVFDLPCAMSLVRQPNRLDYTPEMIQTLQALLRATERVAGRLEEQRRALGNPPAEFSRLLTDSETDTARRFRNINRRTTDDEISVMTAYTAGDAARYAVLLEALRDDPGGRARIAEEKTKQLRGFKVQLSQVATVLSDAGLDAFGRAHEEAYEAIEAASLARDVFASNSELPDVGAAAWRSLWEAAREYSEQAAYPGVAFPVVDDASCVLCQQPIGDEARTRMQAFEEFVASETQRMEDEKREAMRDARERVNTLKLPRSSAVAELLGYQRRSSEWQAVKQFVVAAYLRKRRAFLEDPTYPILPALPDLDSAIAKLEAQAAALREAARDDSRNQMRDELENLAARRTLSPLADSIRDEVRRLGAVAALDSIIQQCDTGRITRKAREAARQIITGKLGASFATNLVALGFDTAGIGISIGEGERAVHPWTMRLMERPDVEPSRILSEGERTCVALAGFLAELAASGNRSAIVLDDPVTSLDHTYRDRVARRLVEEATSRQVIVLTHEIVFLYELRKHASAAALNTHELSLERGHKRHGVVREGAPWVALPVSRRTKQIRDDIRRAQSILEAENREAYDLMGEAIYKRLRQTWERAIEECLLARVVLRFDTDVQTKRLRYLTDITDEDVRTVDREMSYCSDFMHDDAGPRTVDIPGPDQIRRDVDRLEEWIASIEARRRKK